MFSLHYAVFAVAISFLAIISSVIKRKVHVSISIDSKLLLYIIVGFLLIVDGVTNIPSHIARISYLYQSASTVQGENRYTNEFYVFDYNTDCVYRYTNRNWSILYIDDYKTG